MRRVLACIDLSEPSEAVLDCASGLAAPDGRLVILHVAAPEPDFVGYGVGPSSVRDSVASDLRREHRDVQELAHARAATGISVTPLVVQGAIVEKILDHATRLNSDFIVLASKGHSAMHDLVAGSVVRGVLQGAKVPVVVVPRHANEREP
jgi:nucleotide-binding universal stress UspA family protein